MTNTSGQSVRLGTGAGAEASAVNGSTQRWRTTRLLYSTHLPLIVIVWLAAAVVLALVTVGVGVFGSIEKSAWEVASSAIRWLVLGYSTYFISKVLPIHVANGQTRREYLRQAAVFGVGAVGVASALMTLGYVVERVLYQAADLPQKISQHRLFDSGYDVVPIFLTFYGMFAVWVVVGAMCSAGFYRSQELGVLTLVPALVLIAATAVAVGDDGLPLIGRVRFLDAPILVAMATCAAATAIGATLTWLIARDMPLNTKKS